MMILWFRPGAGSRPDVCWPSLLKFTLPAAVVVASSHRRRLISYRAADDCLAAVADDRPGGLGPGLAGRRGSRLGDLLADPAHPLGGRLGVVADSCAIRLMQPRVPNWRTARLIAAATLSTVGAANRCGYSTGPISAPASSA
jgi:hypothetical protein